MAQRRRAGIGRAVLIAIAVLWSLFPLYWMYSTAFKPEALDRRLPPVFVFQPSFEHYRRCSRHTVLAVPHQHADRRQRHDGGRAGARVTGGL